MGKTGESTKPFSELLPINRRRDICDGSKSREGVLQVMLTAKASNPPNVSNLLLASCGTDEEELCTLSVKAMLYGCLCGYQIQISKISICYILRVLIIDPD